MSFVRPIGLSMLALATLACGVEIPDATFACASDDDCPSGFTCEADGLCHRSATDGGGMDAAGLDAAVSDGGTRDAAAVDASARDAMTLLDATPIDAAVPDATLPDAAGADAGTDAAAGSKDSGGPECAIAFECDDGNPCTDEDCVEGVCARARHTRPCDDGMFCNGADTCDGAGGCTVHAGDPCPGACVGGACEPCGLYDQPCCDGNACDGGRFCDTSSNRCGCETGGDCPSGFACDSDRQCHLCGEPPFICCEDGTCFAGQCIGRVCDFVGVPE